MKQALLLIDLQKGLGNTEYYGTERNNPEAESNAIKLLDEFRTKGLPIYHVKHDSTNPKSPLYPGKPGNDLIENLKPEAGEPLFSKNVNSAFIGTDLEERLKKDKVTHLIIAGLTTEHCVSTSTRMAANLGFDVTLISDATAAFDKIGSDGSRYTAQMVYDISIATLKDEFAKIMGTESLINAM